MLKTKYVVIIAVATSTAIGIINEFARAFNRLMAIFWVTHGE